MIPWPLASVASPEIIEKRSKIRMNLFRIWVSNLGGAGSRTVTWLVLASFAAILMQLAQPLIENCYARGDDHDDKAADSQRVLRSEFV